MIPVLRFEIGVDKTDYGCVCSKRRHFGGSEINPLVWAEEDWRKNKFNSVYCGEDK